ncbi:MAG: hypothetical protein JWN15_2421 [Firmicutes bacterium]|nr:hypothetical protein [Bacillota bacterium]
MVLLSAHPGQHSVDFIFVVAALPVRTWAQAVNSDAVPVDFCVLAVRCLAAAKCGGVKPEQPGSVTNGDQAHISQLLVLPRFPGQQGLDVAAAVSALTVRIAGPVHSQHAAVDVSDAPVKGPTFMAP